MRTKANTTQGNFGSDTWRGPRRASTFLLQMAQADAERGERIRWLREEQLHLTQEAMADKVGLTVRGYQEWEAGGGIKWDNVKKLAKVGGVDPEWIMRGDRGDTPDLSRGSDADVQEIRTRFEALDLKIERMAEAVTELATAVSQLVRLEQAQDERQTQEKQERKSAKRSAGTTPASRRRSGS